METGEVIASGHVTLEQEDLTLVADRIVYLRTADLVRAEGHVQVRSPLGLLSANSLQYGLATRAGFGRDLDGAIYGFSIRARQFQLYPPPGPHQGPILIALDGAITSCTFNHPDYLLQAKWIRLQPADSLRVRQATVSLFGLRLVTLPSAGFRLRPRTARESRPSLAPSVGVSSTLGAFVRERWAIPPSRGLEGRLELILSTKQTLSGGAILNPLGGTRTQITLYRKLEIPRYNYPHLLVDMLPEARVRFGNSYSLSPGWITFIGDAAAGEYQEYTHRASGGRLQLRSAGIWRPGTSESHPIVGLGISLSRYAHSSYSLFGAELGYRSLLGHDLHGTLSLVSSGFSGRTPFAFDRLESSRILQGLLESTNPRTGWRMDLSYDLRAHHLYDGVVSFYHTLRCIQPSIGMRLIDHQIMLGLTIPALEGFRSRPTVSPFTRGLPAFTWNNGESLPAIQQ